eukprot:2100421-Amphidinium_carterae.1
MSIGAVALVLGCPALPVGIGPVGPVELAAVDGLGTDCARLDGGGTVLAVAVFSESQLSQM